MLNITNQSDYALLFVSSLLGQKDYIPLSQLTSSLKLPKRFLARIAAKLVEAGILESKEGKVGGYKLIKKLDEINLYKFLTVFEGELSFVKCSDLKYQCIWAKRCRQRKFLSSRLNKVVIDELKKWSLKDLIKI